MQPDLPVGTFLISEKSIAFDGMLHFYAGSEDICDKEFLKEFCHQMDWPAHFNRPVVVNADSELVNKIGKDDMKRGVTISANGFYGPQGRELRIPIAKPDMNSKLEQFSYKNYRITNYEMESSAVAGLALLLGHKAMTVCLVIANRMAQDANTDYKISMRTLIETVLERL
jgi:uridine phosphorylase